MSQWLKANVIKLKKWKNNLFTLVIQAPINSFVAGQFTKLSYVNSDKKRIQRAYSFINPPHDKNLEFYILLIKTGQLTPRLYDIYHHKIYIAKNSFGFFTITELPSKENIWMIATGTALGPYCSILQHENILNKFNKIILVYAVKYNIDLNYLNIFKKIKNKYKDKIIIKIILSQEKNKKYLYGRIPDLIRSGKLEKSINEPLHIDTSHVMLCGNPNMIQDTQKILFSLKNMKKHFRRKPGHITSENYW
ncbi:Flavodoxin/ferredoxin--NADP reductase [Buchnera aphidicola (Cinara kochiana kochiana)]|uniref:Flavodoxin/ferredoxin--NADP reductase n=1 Tax=Buchnera aphidicola (Cinara kochiana kochiana) TaxID=2518976 RepID=A0A451D678_9GAMM|nr:ferredoxin--NADP reductase [Buchnera aphidicola]VFP81283.1 Flavodoxin/ferredoxin--NADP reductase [Buchnera aphidicola (Cinara kochiana kochiana)]